MEAMLNRFVENQKQFRWSLFEEFQASMERLNDSSNQMTEASIASLNRSSEAVEKNGLRMRK